VEPTHEPGTEEALEFDFSKTGVHHTAETKKDKRVHKHPLESKFGICPEDDDAFEQAASCVVHGASNRDNCTRHANLTYIKDFMEADMVSGDQ